MDALILFSHGSLLCGAGETLNDHARALASRGGYCAVEVGFLNFSEPTFEQAVQRCVSSGASRIIVVPYFLIPGYFVNVDLPRHVDAVRPTLSAVEIVIAEALGYDMLVADALLDQAEHSCGPDQWRRDYENAGQFCEFDPDCPLHGGALCPASQ